MAPRTGMVNSSAKAQPSKGGAGGSYTWGSALDVQDYVPSDLAAGCGMETAPQVACQTITVFAATSQQKFQLDQQAFPALSAAAPARVESNSRRRSAGPAAKVSLEEKAFSFRAYYQQNFDLRSRTMVVLYEQFEPQISQATALDPELSEEESDWHVIEPAEHSAAQTSWMHSIAAEFAPHLAQEVEETKAAEGQTVN